jgi:aminopeptidase N
MRCLLLFLFLSCAAFAQSAPEGIPRELARQRAAQIGNVRYELKFTIDPKNTTITGREFLTFILKEKPLQDVLLDYRDGTVATVLANGNPQSEKQDNGHLHLSAVALHAGENKVEIEFTSHVAPAGKPFTRYDDRDDGSAYIYTLFVPMDASMAFPCFDQPDMKGRFKLTVNVPDDWSVVSNTATEGVVARRFGIDWPFAETKPISTYLFAFAAGPFKKLESPGLTTLYVRKSKLARARAEGPEVQKMAAAGIKFLSTYFAQPFPFPKYDQVLIPGFAYGGMEHAGATFLREESVLFRTAPTRTDLLGRDILVLHELTHQWFGDLTTMRWFDDLWLKEGFAQYMAYAARAAIVPEESQLVWKRFYETIKPAAYAIDVTKGTTPIYQDIANLKDAKSAYGAIVYSKAPGVLKQLAFVLGDEHFRDGLRLYLKEHAFANAEWGDLVSAFERTSGQKLDRWAEVWIRHRGMPQVDLQWSCAAGKLAKLALTQHDVLNEGGVWPIKTEVLLVSRNTTPPSRSHLSVSFSTPSADVMEARGQACPDYVFANDRDWAYGRFLLDQSSQKYLLSDLADKDSRKHTDLFTRALLWGSLWEAVRVAELAPRDYIAATQTAMPPEHDESLLASMIGRTATALHRYVPASSRPQLEAPLEREAILWTAYSGTKDLSIVWFRGLRAFAEGEAGRRAMKDLLSGKAKVPGVELRPLDRWNMVTTLLALNDPEADKYFAAERERDHTGDGLKYAYIAEAARPDPATKEKYFDDYLRDPQRPPQHPEDWVEQSLGAFNYWNHSELTAPYLKPALDALPQIKRDRKIFFLVAWLNAFIENQVSAESDAAVHGFLRASRIDHDLELKVLQSVDELDRTVMIRQKFPD